MSDWARVEAAAAREARLREAFDLLSRENEQLREALGLVDEGNVHWYGGSRAPQLERYCQLRAALAAAGDGEREVAGEWGRPYADAMAKSPDMEKVTHGRHCTCPACEQEDWTQRQLAPCGMHGPGCPRAYAPLGAAGEWVAAAGDGETP